MQDKEKEPENGEEIILKLFLAMCFDTSGKLKNLLTDEVKKGIVPATIEDNPKEPTESKER